MHILFTIFWFSFCFIIAIGQSYFSTLLYDENGKFSIFPLLRNNYFWGFLIIWIIGNLLIHFYNKKREQDFEMDWMRKKGKMIEDVMKKTKRGDYSGASETIKIISELDEIVRDKQNE